MNARVPTVVELTPKDLTPKGEIYCPHPKAGMQRWDTHPRVFLHMTPEGVMCPYCGTKYRLAAPAKPSE